MKSFTMTLQKGPGGTLNGNSMWPDLVGRDVHQVSSGVQAIILNGDGRSPSIAMRMDLADGSVVLVEVEARLFCAAAKMVEARYPDLYLG